MKLFHSQVQVMHKSPTARSFRSYGFCSSAWQVNSLERGGLGLVLVACLFVFSYTFSAVTLSYCVQEAAFAKNRSDELTVESELSDFSSESGTDQSSIVFDADASFIGRIGEWASDYASFFKGEELAVLATSGLCMALLLPFFWRVYRRGYDISEEPVEKVDPEETVERKDKWFAAFECEPCTSQAVECFEDEFLLNAMVYPRAVFRRVSEHVQPGRRMLDCDVNYEFGIEDRFGLRAVGIGDVSLDLAKQRHPNEVFPCRFIVPVSFQKRGALALKQEVRDPSGIVLPVVKQTDITDKILKMISNYFEDTRRGGTIMEARLKWKSYMFVEMSIGSNGPAPR